jgi:hypothetical protein
MQGRQISVLTGIILFFEYVRSTLVTCKACFPARFPALDELWPVPIAPRPGKILLTDIVCAYSNGRVVFNHVMWKTAGWLRIG